jgi:hypothetical protein
MRRGQVVKWEFHRSETRVVGIARPPPSCPPCAIDLGEAIT